MAALMTFEMSDTDKVADYREECAALGIAVEPPSINISDFDFVVDDADPGMPLAARRQCQSETLAGKLPVAPRGNDRRSGSPIRRGAIRFGLGAIKGVGGKAVAAILDARQNGAFRDLFDLCERIDLTAVNKGTLEALVCAGAFDQTGAMRRALHDAIPDALGYGQTAQQDRRAGQMGLFSVEPESTAAPPPRLTHAEWSEAEMLAREKAVLGFYITKHPLTKFGQLLDACATTPVGELEKYQDGQEVVLGGMVTNLRTLVSRTGRNAGKNIGIVTLEDLSGKVEGIVFSDDLNRYRSLLVPDTVLFLQGQVDRKREAPALRVTRAVPIDQAVESFTRTMLVDVDETTPVEKLIELFRAHRGECRVYFNVATQDGLVAQIECNPGLRVSCKPDFLAALAAILPPDSWKLLGGKRKIIPTELQPSSPLLPVAL